jgi:tyrosinase
MAQDSESVDTSHFSISGIHGVPFKQWESSGGSGAQQGSQWGGYCTHGTVLFPTWHRPYMAVYEVSFSAKQTNSTDALPSQQVLQQHAKTIAGQYTVDQDRWTAAAESLRLPYWDWGVNAIPPDEVIALPTLNIPLPPNGTVTAFGNPLYGYKFNPIPPQFQRPFNTWSQTLRHPTTQNPNAQDDVNGLKRSGSHDAFLACCP